MNPVRGYKYIVIHHTGTPNKMTAEEMKLSMIRSWINNKGGTYIPTHYIVGSDGSFLKVKELDKIVGATKNADANWNGIHIEVVGDFRTQTPSDKQYAMVKQLIKRLQDKYPGLEVKKHNDFGATACPGVNFDMDKIAKKTTQTKDGYMVFDATRYYSPVQGQDHYYKGKSYADDVCMNCGCGGDCSIPANGIRLTDDMAGLVVACPSEYPLGTKFEIQGYGVVTCVDRGSAIKNNKLDIWVGYGHKGLNVIETKKRPAGTIYVKVVK